LCSEREEILMKSPAPEKFKIVKEISRPHVVFRLARVPETTKVFFGTSDFKVYAADTADAKFEAKELYAHESYVTGVTLVGKTLISGSYDGKLIWWDTETNKQIRSVEAHSKWIRNVIASPDGKLIASIADDMVCRLWDTSTGKKVHELRGHQEKTPHHFLSMLYAVTFSSDGKLLATGDKVGHVVVWNVADGKSLATLEAPVMYTWDQVQRLHSIGGIRSLAFSSDGKQLAVGGMGKVGNIDHLEGKTRVEVFEWEGNKKLHEFVGDKFNGLVNQLAFAPDGSWLVGSGGAGEGSIQFFDVANKKVLRQEKVGSHIHDLILSKDADSGIAVGHNRIVLFEMK
jgi:WD40 repeat protein